MPHPNGPNPEPPSSERAPNTNLLLLKAAVKEIENMKETNQAYRDMTDKQVKVLNAENLALQSGYKQMQADIENLKKQVAVLNRGMGVQCIKCDNDKNMEEHEEEMTGMRGDIDGAQPILTSLLNDVDPATVDLESLSPEQRESLSLEAAISKPVKDAINEAFARKIGFDNLEAKSLPAFPSTIDPSMWPKDPATQKPLQRYNWVLTSGMLRVLLPKDLKFRICKKYQYMARQFCTKERKEREWETHQQQLEAAELQNLDDNKLEDDAPVSLPISKAHRNSRAQSKLDQHIHKRPLSVYTDPKFDAAFIINAMLDNKDDPDYRPTSNELKKYISHAPHYHNPNPNKEKAMTPHIRGHPIANYKIPSAKLLKNRLRVWQIKPDLLALPEYSSIVGLSQLAHNGNAWGDDEDPVDDDLTGGNQARRKRK
ncbi:hypothetical protein SERLADRAFT_439913 [Serpula lacrymans var. lacrymans S7.9]|uniref:Uncharacterized protein n=1 Tax=Serpula lacrymans var. lacrymans (strain S7.9) TaxID=578457 RepID=F8P1Z6_SERL9|nr:uncharacterized protein SERLADRAFT_439913 [Serpula lacrymans var. lacrymans S7.9]EGO23174.1 hypothetical protein SERLADRAFT_439913 [Serpula lacrymans var. lacrymans S7.9]